MTTDRLRIRIHPMENKVSREAFRSCVRKARGNIAEAVRMYSGESLVGVAEGIGETRQAVSGCLNRTDGRLYTHVRRAIEVYLDLPPYTLDEYL